MGKGKTGIVYFIVSLPSRCADIALFWSGKKGFLTLLAIIFAILAVGVIVCGIEEYKENQEDPLISLLVGVVLLIPSFLVSAIVAKILTIILTLFFFFCSFIGTIGLIIAVVFFILILNVVISMFPPM